MLFNKIRGLFNRKREQSEYLKFEDGDIISVDTVDKPYKSDKAPRLNVKKDSGTKTPLYKTPQDLYVGENEDDAKGNKKKLIDKLLLYVILAFIVTLAIYLFDLSKIFMNKTSDYMSTGKVSEEQKSSDTATNSTDEVKESKGTLENKTIEVIPEPSKANNKLIDLLQLVVQSNNAIQTNYKKAKTEVIYYADSKSTKYILTSALEKVKNNTDQSYNNFIQYEEAFSKAGLKALYDIQIERLGNLKALVTNIEKAEGRHEAVSIANTHINKENELVKKQVNSFIDVLDKNDIPYTNVNGSISYTIK